MSCYDGPNPVREDDRYAIWKWAKENAIDSGASIEKVHEAVNDYFFAGQAKAAWINDILQGRKTPLRKVTDELWRKQYNRQSIIQQAAEMHHKENLGPFGRAVMKLRFLPRALAVAGHGVVFPITHAGDLLLRPESWGTTIKGLYRTYHAVGSSAFAAKVLNEMSHDSKYEFALHSGLDVGPKSHPVGIISNTGGKTGYGGAGARAWDMLTVLRYELWRKQVNKMTKAGMTPEDVASIGKDLAEWANHATGSGKGGIAKLGGGTLFGPKLTQSKLNRISVDPIKTVKTLANWKTATAGEKAVFWTRVSGSTQYVATALGFLAVNQGVLYALGQDDKINFTDPMRSDWMAFKGFGIKGYIPGLHTELKALGKLFWIANAAKKDLRGKSKASAAAESLGQYGMAKLEPGIQKGMEIAFGQDYQGRPLPWSKEDGTPSKPKLSMGEYLGSIGPIPLEGSIGYFYDHMRGAGMSALDTTTLIKGIVLFGAGLPGFHAQEDHSKDKKKSKSKSALPKVKPGEIIVPGL